MKRIFIFSAGLIISLFISTNAFAMTTYDFDKGMKNGIEYFNNKQYYEAFDEFKWFMEANYNKLNQEQKDYFDEYYFWYI